MAEDGQSGSGRVALSGSVREPLPGARRVSDVDPATEIDLTIVVRRKAPAEGIEVDTTVPPAEARQRLAAAAGADPQDLAAVEQYVREQGMEVASTDAARRVVIVRTTAAKAMQAFDVALGHYEADGISYRGREGAVHLPADVAEKIEAVLGLDDRPQARIHLKQGAPLPENELPPVGSAVVASLKVHYCW